MGIRLEVSNNQFRAVFNRILGVFILLHYIFNRFREDFMRLHSLFNQLHPFFPTQKNAPLTVVITVSGAIYVLSYT